MSEHRQIAQYLRTSAAGYAALASEHLLAREPGVEERWAPAAFRLWKGQLERLVRDLAAAVQTGTPGLWEHHVAWHAALFAAREAPLADLAAALRCLLEVLGQELPAPLGEHLAPFANATEAALARTPAAAAPPPPETPVDELATDYTQALLEGRGGEAGSLLLDAVRRGERAAEEVMDRVLLRVQAELGARWSAGEASIGEEHLVTTNARILLAQLATLLPHRPRRQKRVLLGAVQGNNHDIGLQVIAALLDADGFDVINLGADTPHADLREAVARYRPDLIGLSATLLEHRVGLQELIEELGTLGTELPPILAGGQAFLPDEDPAALGLTALARSHEEAVRLARDLSR